MEELEPSGFCAISLSEGDKEYVRLIEKCVAEIALSLPAVIRGTIMQDKTAMF